MICPKCGTQIEPEDARVCYRHGNYYCVWCAENNKEHCEATHYDSKPCQVAEDNGIPF